MTFVPGGVPGAPRDAEVMRQFGKAKEEELERQAAARKQAHDARRGRLRRLLLRRGAK